MRFWSRSSCCAVRIRGTRGSERGFVCRFCNCSLRLAIAEHFVVLCRDRSCRKGYLKTCEIAMFASPVSAGHGRRVLACLLCKDSLRLVIECAMPCSAEVRDASGVIEERADQKHSRGTKTACLCNHIRIYRKILAQHRNHHLIGDRFQIPV